MFGLLGVIALYAVWMSILKKTPSLTSLKISSLTALVSLLLSWFSGGYYYVTYYGDAVKPIIKGGDFPWAHLVFMETKEHVFLMLPFVAVVLAAAFWLQGDRALTDPKIKRSLAILAAVATVIGIFIALAGIIVSGGAR